MRARHILTLGIAMALPVLASQPPFPPVAGFVLERYLGTWYEIARFPHSFERGLDHVTATYEMRPDGMVSVLNKGMREGKQSSAKGKAKFAGAADIGHLKVSFFLWFYADYLVVELDKDYQYALVLSNSPDYLWILSRTPTLEPAILDRLKNRAAALGFDLSKLIMVKQ